MFAKLAFMILALGAIGCGLLALRQSRFQAASELAQAQVRIARADEQLLALRAQVAARITPPQVERSLDAAGPMRPMAQPIPTPEPTDEEADANPGEDAPVRPRPRPEPTSPER